MNVSGLSVEVRWRMRRAWLLRAVRLLRPFVSDARWKALARGAVGSVRCEMQVGGGPWMRVPLDPGEIGP